jgi:hypothetical protein
MRYIATAVSGMINDIDDGKLNVDALSQRLKSLTVVELRKVGREFAKRGNSNPDAVSRWEPFIQLVRFELHVRRTNSYRSQDTSPRSRPTRQPQISAAAD